MMDSSTATKPHVRWSAYDHHHEQKGSDWFWALGVIAASVAATFVLLGNFLFALLVLVAAGTLGVIASKEPKMVEFTITEKGLWIDDTLFTYDIINAFWVNEYEDDEDILLIDTLKVFAPHLVIPLPNVDPKIIREALGGYVEERELTEPLSHRLFELIGF